MRLTVEDMRAMRLDVLQYAPTEAESAAIDTRINEMATEYRVSQRALRVAILNG